MKNYPFTSIIIPLYVISDRFFKDVKKLQKIDYPNYEILIVSDRIIDLPKWKNVKLIVTGHKRTGPAEKRDIALKHARGEICAFIDDDAYPHREWLKKAVIHFQHPNIAAVGGPGVTPKEDNFWEQLTGLVYESYLCGGKARHRFVPESLRFVYDYPAYNLIVRKDILQKIGGYGSHYYGGEDTLLCLKIIKRGWLILYDPEVIVYHHRRALFMPYLKQIANIGKHRGYFVKKFPETSRQFFYFIPSLLAIGFFLSFFLSFFSHFLRSTFIGVSTILLLIGAFSVIKKTNILNAFIVSVGIILTHIVYGSYFLNGLFAKKLMR